MLAIEKNFSGIVFYIGHFLLSKFWVDGSANDDAAPVVQRAVRLMPGSNQRQPVLILRRPAVDDIEEQRLDLFRDWAALAFADGAVV